jgi:hypothetical protein
MHGTIERMRCASWILHPTCLIDAFLDRLEKLGAVLAAPTRGAGLSCSEAPVALHLKERAGA